MVLVSQFRDPDLGPEPSWYENESILNYVTMGVLFLGFIAFALLIVRPMIFGLYGKLEKTDPQKLLAKGETAAGEDSEDGEIDILSEDQVEEAGVIKAIYRDGEKTIRGEAELRARSEETGETLEEIKARLKPRRSNVSADMFDTANTYDDKVAIVRMLVDEDSSRVASLLKKMVGAKGTS